MTAQTPDQLMLDQGEFAIVGVNGGDLFSPDQFGLQPMPFASNCWRGYVCQYVLRAGQLMLDQLEVNLQPPGEGQTGLSGPAINGIQPAAPQSRIPFFNHVYAHLNLVVPFSGGLLAGADFIPALYVHMGFHPAWKYEIVFELIVFDGQVTEVRDVSETMSAIRAARAKQPLRPDPRQAGVDMGAWIRSTFKLNYDL